MYRCTFITLAAVLILTLNASELLADTPDAPLPKDPNNFYGQFDNGFHYLVRHNANPPGKVALYLEVRTGAFNETERQNGLAHFIEHMAFKGSAHFKPATLIPLLTHLGMSFGADTNAHTNQWETTYKLTMPDNKPETIDTALTIFSDYASALAFYPVQIDSERRVILEELRARRNVEQRLDQQENALLYPATVLSRHDVKGIDEQIKTFPQSQFLDYWNTWYRPENMTLVVVGDIDPNSMIAQAKAKLGTFTARAPARPKVKSGIAPFVSSRAFVMSDSELVDGWVRLITVKPGRPIVTTFSQLRHQALENLCAWIINRRLDDLVTQGKAPFRIATLEDGDYGHEGYIFEVSARGMPGDWNEMLRSLISELSRANHYGFTPQEVDLCKRVVLSGDEWGIKTESTRDSTAIVGALAHAIGFDEPLLSAQQVLDLDKQILSTVTPEELHQTFVEDFKTDNYAYVLQLPAAGSVKMPSNADVMAAAKAAWNLASLPPSEVAQAPSPLAAEPSAGQVVWQETDKDIGVTTAKFANGVVLHHKFTDYKKDQVIIHIGLPGGVIEETAGNRGISAAASLILHRPATSRLSPTQIRDLFVGRNVTVSGDLGLDTLSITVSGAAKDLEFGMQVANAELTDGKLEPVVLDEWKKSELQSLASRKMRPEAQIAEAESRTVLGNDIRFVQLSEEMIRSQNVGGAEAWFHHIADHAAIEVTVAGDIPLSQALELVGRYIGSLPVRTEGFDALNKLRYLNRAPGPYASTVHFTSSFPKAVVIAGMIGCDLKNPDRRPLALASLILSSRMIETIRVQDQLVYSIECQSVLGRSLPGTGTFSAGAPTDPKNADKLADTILQMIRNFAADGPTDQELADAKKQVANQFNSMLNDPSYWVTQLGELSYRGRLLSEVKELPAAFQTYTVEQVRDAVRKCVSDQRTIRIEAIPDAPEAPTTLPSSVLLSGQTAGKSS